MWQLVSKNNEALYWHVKNRIQERSLIEKLTRAKNYASMLPFDNMLTLIENYCKLNTYYFHVYYNLFISKGCETHLPLTVLWTSHTCQPNCVNYALLALWKEMNELISIALSHLKNTSENITCDELFAKIGPSYKNHTPFIVHENIV